MPDKLAISNVFLISLAVGVLAFKVAVVNVVYSEVTAMASFTETVATVWTPPIRN